MGHRRSGFRRSGLRPDSVTESRPAHASGRKPDLCVGVDESGRKADLRVGVRALIALLLAAALPTHADGLAQIVAYRSPIDDSTQAYGVYVPATPPPSPAGYPAVLHGHGYGWSVSASFSEFQRRWADEHGWVLINLNARGPNFYEGVGDLETLNVVEDAARRFGLDRDRIYMTGGSMGGTGALRAGLRHPDVFAAVMAVDGWTDFREWHHHWYARADMQDLIEEFRRPLLEAASPLYWAERGRWGAIGHIVDGADTTVLPENGLRLRQRLLDLYAADPAGYDQLLIFNPTYGHGRGTDYRAIYGFFEGRRRVADPTGFEVQTTILPHGELYWGRIDGFIIDGRAGNLAVQADGAVISARTTNLSAFTLHLGTSPAANEPVVRVYADGFPAYEGPPTTVALEADLNGANEPEGWHEAEARPGPRKRPGMSGPLGDAFVRPFTVVWGNAGPPEQVARHRVEAEQFAREWNDFNVHAPAVRARPEDRAAPADLAGKSLVVFGSLDTSDLLRRADAARPLPVRIHEDGVIVRDPLHGDRRYRGDKFGAMLCVPNPLTGDATYLVVANRRLFMKPDGGQPQLLGYDLEKLPWAYPDYVVFNTDQSELPFVLNVNDKPPVTCYEAAYYVEAGFFDAAWRVDRALELRRVIRQRPELHRLVHVAALSLDTAADPPAAVVRITDAAGVAAPSARVTGRWWGEGEAVASASADEDGRALFPAPAGMDLRRASFEVVNVMATGCTYDWTADTVRALAPGEASPRPLAPTLLSDRPAVRPEDALTLRLAVHNHTPRARVLRVRLSAPTGDLLPAARTVRVCAGGRSDVSFEWRPGYAGPRTVTLRAEVMAQDGGPVATAALEVPVRVLPARGLPVTVAEVKGADLEWGSPWKVTARLRNYGCEPVTITAHCALLEARRFPAAKTVTVPPGESVVVEWTGDERLERGEYTTRVTVAGGVGITGTAQFAIR